MELDLQSLFGLLCTAVPRNSPPPPAFGLVYEGGAIVQTRKTTSLGNPLALSRFILILFLIGPFLLFDVDCDDCAGLFWCAASVLEYSTR
jgi:hypothetical protein